VVKAITLHQGGSLPPADISVFPRITFDVPLPEPVAAVWEGPPRVIEARGRHVGESITWERIAPKVNYPLLGRIQERVEGRITVEIVDASTSAVLASSSKHLSLLAPNQWQFEPSYHEVLAAFVLPSDPYVAEILKRAREILEERTGDSSTEGYQSEVFDERPLHERSRAYKIAHAVYDAMRDMGYAYSNPPGIFDGGAQRIRTPSQVRNEECATCIDSSVLMAACFAQAGLEPVLFLVHGHAFAGYFTGAPLVDTGGRLQIKHGVPTIGEAAVRQLTGRLGTQFGPALRRGRADGFIQELLRFGHVQAVETTTTTRGRAVGFPEACALGLDASLDEAKFETLILVGSAWRSGITPPVSLDKRFIAPRPPAQQPDSPISDTDSPGPSTGSDEHLLETLPLSEEERSTPPRVRQWLASLLDLSSRNPLLKIKPTQLLEFEVPPAFLGTLDDLLFTPKKRIEIVSPAELPFEWVHEGVTRSDYEAWLSGQGRLVYPEYTSLNGIQRHAESLVAAVRGQVGDPIRGLGPQEQQAIEKIRADRHHCCHGLSDGELMQELREYILNKLRNVLRGAVSKVQTKAKESMLASGSNGLYLALGTVAWSESSDFRGKRTTTEWCAPLYLYPVILEGGKGSPFTIRLDPNGAATPNYCLHEKLRREPYNLDLRELVNPAADDLGIDLAGMISAIEQRLRQAKQHNFAVQPRALLGVFDYSTFRLWKDLKDSWRQMCEISPATKHLIYTPNTPFKADPPPTGPRPEPHLPIAADDSQREAVQRALEGQSFRLEGPPGTGKSQTITNLLGSCIAENKKVLFVAEKQTALNAVKERLDGVGLGNYCLNLHAKGDSDARLRKNISDALTNALAQRVDPAEQAWRDLTARLEREQQALDRYRDSLHGGEDGLSAWVANEERISLGAGPVVEVPRSFVSALDARWPAFLEAAAAIDAALELVPNPNTHPWRFVTGCRIISSEHAAITAHLEDLLASCNDLTRRDPAFVNLVNKAGAEHLGAMAAAARLQAEGRLNEVALSGEPAANASASGIEDEQDLLLDDATTEWTSIAARLAPHSDFVTPDFMDAPNAQTITAALDRGLDATTSLSFREVTEAWANLAEQVGRRIPIALADQLLTRDDADGLEQAVASFEPLDRKAKIDALRARVRTFDNQTQAHSANVAPNLLGRADLVNVTLLLEAAAGAGRLSRGRKIRELRALLAEDARATDDRLLLHSLRELVKLMPEANAIRDAATEIFPATPTDGLLLWSPGDFDRFLELARSDQTRELAREARVTLAPGDDSSLPDALRAAIQLIPDAKRCRELLHRSFPDVEDNSLRPWSPESLVQLSTMIRTLLANQACDALGPYATGANPDRTLVAAQAVVEAWPKVVALRERIITEVCPGYTGPIRPWDTKDLAAVIVDRNDCLRVGRLLRARAVTDSLLHSPIDSEVVSIVARLDTAWSGLMASFEVTAASLANWEAGRGFVSTVTEEVPVLLRDGGENHRFLELTRWSRLLDAVSALRDLELADLVDIVMSGEMPADALIDATRRTAISMALRDRIEHGNLDRFDRKVHERRIRIFESSLDERRTLLSQRIPGLVIQRRSARALPSGSDVGATQALLRGLRPIRGERTPIRDLLAKYGNALAEAMPCFLMSPDSVATLLPVGAIDFDLVVFDEASQIRTSHAVGALGRARAGVVVGDSKQMPPSNAFSSNSGVFIDNEEGEEEDPLPEPDDDSDVEDENALSVLMRPAAAPDAESILSEYQEAEFPHLQLLCHYRSKDELLIAFSNTYIYDEPMLTFPSTFGIDSTALQFVHVEDGRFERDRNAPPIRLGEGQPGIPTLRTNRREAEEVVGETLRRLRDPERRRRRSEDRDQMAESIIIVTFNLPQMRLIEALLRAADPDLFDAATTEGEPDEVTGRRTPPQLKIRNLESVQGDEAELVIFSVAFSRTPKGTFPLNFGPVTQPGGVRRLNVAVTRAQREMIVFCSFLPEEMSAGGRNLSEGAQMVQRFLSLARYGAQARVDVGVDVPRSGHIEEIAESLRLRGYEVQTQLGLSTLRVDIAVRRPTAPTWELAIMVDDSCWAERGSAFQRELLPRQVLPALGWKGVRRIWLPSWLNERDELLDEIDALFTTDLTDPIFVEDPDDDPGEEAIEPSLPHSDASVTGHFDEIAEDASPRLHKRFDPFPISIVGDASVLDLAGSDDSARRRVRAVIDGILDCEAPVQLERLAKLTCNCFGLNRVAASRIEQVTQVIPALFVANDTVGTFVWSESVRPGTWREYRTSLDGIIREYDQISTREYANALIDVVEKSYRIDHETAVREIARIFGFLRITANARQIIESVFTWAVAEGLVARIDGDYIPA